MHLFTTKTDGSYDLSPIGDGLVYFKDIDDYLSFYYYKN